MRGRDCRAPRRRSSGDPIADRVGVGAVADEVAAAEGVVVAAGGLGEDGLESLDVGMEVADNEIAHGEVELSLSEPQERDLRRRSDTSGNADGSDTAGDIRRGISLTIQAVNVGSEEARRVDRSIQNLDRDLSAMSMSRKQQIITLSL